MSIIAVLNLSMALNGVKDNFERVKTEGGNQSSSNAKSFDVL